MVIDGAILWRTPYFVGQSLSATINYPHRSTLGYDFSYTLFSKHSLYMVTALLGSIGV